MVYDRQQGTITLRSNDALSASSKAINSTQILSNSQCQLGAASAVLNNLQLIVTVNLTFSGTFSGPKSIYLFAAEANVNTGWIARGTYQVLAPGNPQLTSVVPSSGSGPRQRFTVTVSDAAGASYINGVAVLFNSTSSPDNACNMVYDRNANTISLSYQTAANGSDKLVVGSSTTIGNSQCSLYGANSTALVSGPNLVLTLDLSFNATFTGPKNIYVYAAENTASTPDQILGTWTVTGGVPSADSVSPSSGAGNSPVFTATVSDSSQGANLTGVYILLTNGAPTSFTNTCYVYFNRAAGTVGLFADDGVTLNTKVLGSSAALQNSQCAIGYSVAFYPGNSIQFQVNTVFKSAFAGPKTVYVKAVEPASDSGFVARGTWTAQ
jgi:hypothetical protein